MLSMLSGIAILAQVSATAPRTGEDVIRRMYEVGGPKWYRTLTFVQTTSFNNRPDQIWYESMQLPGKLRIDTAPVDSMNTTLYLGDSTYSYRRGVLGNPRAGGNPLAILFGDVFAEPVDVTIKRLLPYRFDMTKVHVGKWDNRPVWVVGAMAGDTVSPQFWVDQERMYVGRLIYGSATAPTDVKVMAHQPAAGGWVETDIRFFRNGVEIQKEVYNDIKVNPVFDADLFTPGPWKKPSWIKP